MNVDALICDDQGDSVKLVRSYLTRYCEEHHITCCCDCYTSGKEAAHGDKIYNIAFLDIEMNDTNGIELARVLRNKNRDIIIFFITAYEKYLDDALDLFALRFLKKPLDYSRFYNGLDKAIELLNDSMVDCYLKETGRLIRLKSNTIMYIETTNHKTKVVTTDNVYTCTYLIDEWEKLLTHFSFVRVHKSFIVNMNHIEIYSRKQVILTNGAIIPISRHNQAAFRKAYYSYIKRRTQ
jgi:DNA-binding LytR/AlgR family response regulator